MTVTLTHNPPGKARRDPVFTAFLDAGALV